MASKSSNQMMALQHTFLISCILLLATVSAEKEEVNLQNPDFELPPSNWNASSPSFELNENSTIPGWSFEGTVEYVTAGANLSLPAPNGRAILLGPDGKINQTFTATADSDGTRRQYLLTFVLSKNCSTNNARLLVSAPDSSAEFSLTTSTELWQVYGHWIGSWAGGESVNLVIGSQSVDADQGSVCWPVVDSLQLITVGSVKREKDNLLLNGGFELGPTFPEFSNNGVLLNSEPSLVESALQQWTVTGTVKYINAKNHFVPEGEAAIEILSANSSGIQTQTQLNQRKNYKLEFLLGDANDSCIGDFTVGVGVGSSVLNFTIRSNGSGSARKELMQFTGFGPSTTISFQSYSVGQREDGVLCGPVIDGVVLSAGCVCKLNVFSGLFILSLIFVALVKF